MRVCARPHTHTHTQRMNRFSPSSITVTSNSQIQTNRSPLGCFSYVAILDLSKCNGKDSKKSSCVSTSSPSSELNMGCSYYTRQHEKHLLFLVDKEHYYSQAHSSPEDELLFLVFITSLSLTLYRLMCTVSLLGTKPRIWT